MIVFWIPLFGQDVTIDRDELLDILLSEAENKVEIKSLNDDIVNYKLIIEGKDVIINDYIKVVSNHETIQKGLENALKSTKESYEIAKRKQKWKWLIGFLEGAVTGASILFIVLVL